MATQWGRKETIIWPPHVPLMSYCAIAGAFLLTVFFAWERYAFQLQPLQKAYITDYLRAGVGSTFHAHQSYRLLYLGGSKSKPRLALPIDFAEGEMTLPGGKRMPFALAELAQKQGYRFPFRGPAEKLADAYMYRWLHEATFQQKAPWQVFTISFIEGGICLVLLLALAVPKDIRRFKEMKYGRVLRGPRMLDPKEFNKAQQGDGLGFKTTESTKMMRIPLRKEAQHLQLMGDTGVGKTQLIMQCLRQIRGRGDSAIIYDPACEYIQRFYDEQRGDIVLNPLDARCPYWGPSQELESEDEAYAIATSLYAPKTDKIDEFFHETPAQIFAHLLKCGPTPHQLAAWMSSDAELMKMVDGTEMAFYIDRKAGPQRAGVLSSLGLVAKSFRMLPEHDEKRAVWNARTWSKTRQGWIFITSRPPERDTLRPLHSLWIDLLVMRLLTAPQPGQKPVWFVIDELASLQRLPQLHTAITENRKSKNPLILGFQGKAQLEVIYGHLAEVMLSQPATKIFMKTAEPQRIVAEAREREQVHYHNPDRVAHAREAVTYARSSLYEREAVHDERLLLRDALRRGMGNTTYPQVRAEFEARQQRGDFLSVESHKYASSLRFTTPETITAERANIDYVRAAKNTVQPIMSAEDAQRQAQSRDFLNDSQKRVIEEVLNSPDRIHGLQGRAGSGKTSVLLSIREGAEKNGFEVEGFAPTSRAAAQLRDAGIDASTLQSFLARKTDVSQEQPPRHLYMLDESSLASTRRMRDFLQKLQPQDRVLVIGDTAQHQGVDAGRPFQQMQEAGMRTAQLDRIMRQKDPALLKAVEHLAKNETQQGIALLHEQGRVTELSDRRDRIAAIARDYAARPENTLVVSPDNKSRQEINEAIRAELLQTGKLKNDGTMFRTLSHRSDMTGADRTWAALYNVGDVVQYNTGSKELGIERGSFTTVKAVDAKANLLTVERADGEVVAYDPRRLRGVNVFCEQEREFATGDRIQFTAPLRELKVANRDLATIERIDGGKMTIRMDGKEKRTLTFDAKQVRQLDHGYAVTSHSSQGLTSERVIAHFDTEAPRGLVNTRLAYVAISRASHDAHIYTNDAARLGKCLATDISKTAAIDLSEHAKKSEVERAVSAFRENDPAKATAILQQDGRVHEYANPEHRLAAVALDYVSQQDRAVVVAPGAVERKELTQLIRDELRQQGRLSSESHQLPVWVEQRFGNPRLVANYGAGDQIHYKVGSAELGIADNSTVTVLSVDAKANRLTVGSLDGSEASYNPALVRGLTNQARVFREETRDVSEGERIRFTSTVQEFGIRKGDFATVERIREDHSLTVRSDQGKSIALSEEQAHHIDYGYTSHRVPPRGVERVIVSGDAAQLAQMQEGFARLSGQTRDLTLYTSDSQHIVQEKTMPGLQVPAPGVQLEIGAHVSVPVPEIAVEGLSRGR